MKFTIHHSGSTGNLYTLRSKDETLLIEAGVPIAKVMKAIDHRIDNVVGALQTHSHRDHCQAAPELMRRGIDCFMTMETADSLKVSGHRLNIIKPGGRFQVGRFYVFPFETKHDVPGSVGFHITDYNQSIIFATDTFYIVPRFEKLDYIAVECNWSGETLAEGLAPIVKKRLLKTHMNLENCIKLIEANKSDKLKAVYLIHLSRGNADAEYFINEVQKACGVPVYADIQ